jgi:hypothetical protein
MPRNLGAYLSPETPLYELARDLQSSDKRQALVDYRFAGTDVSILVSLPSCGNAGKDGSNRRGSHSWYAVLSVRLYSRDDWNPVGIVRLDTSFEDYPSPYFLRCAAVKLGSSMRQQGCKGVLSERGLHGSLYRGDFTLSAELSAAISTSQPEMNGLLQLSRYIWPGVHADSDEWGVITVAISMFSLQDRGTVIGPLKGVPIRD